MTNYNGGVTIEDTLLSDYVDVLNQYGLGSKEDEAKYQSIVTQCPNMSGLLDESRLLHREYNKQ